MKRALLVLLLTLFSLGFASTSYADEDPEECTVVWGT
jgi:hypothetical protein